MFLRNPTTGNSKTVLFFRASLISFQFSHESSLQPPSSRLSWFLPVSNSG